MKLTHRSLFERSERSERSEFCDATKARAPQRSRPGTGRPPQLSADARPPTALLRAKDDKTNEFYLSSTHGAAATIDVPNDGPRIAVIGKTLAAITIAICVVLLARMTLGERRRHRFDAAVRRAFYTVRRMILKAWRWPSSRREAARAAEEAIRRARRDGNVYKPDSFRPPRKPH